MPLHALTYSHYHSVELLDGSGTLCSILAVAHRQALRYMPSCGVPLICRIQIRPRLVLIPRSPRLPRPLPPLCPCRPSLLHLLQSSLRPLPHLSHPLPVVFFSPALPSLLLLSGGSCLLFFKGIVCSAHRVFFLSKGGGADASLRESSFRWHLPREKDHDTSPFSCLLGLGVGFKNIKPIC